MNISEIFHNRYELLQRVGSGGFSEVWKANDMRSGMEVAIKIFRKQDDEGIALCKEEYQKAFEMSHPNLMIPFHFDVDRDHPYLVMKFLSGGTLANRSGDLTNVEAKRLIQQLGSALQYLHFKTNPIIHGDLKPDNILIDEAGNFYLTDFGISTRLQEKFTETMLISSHPSPGKGVTPMAYRSPEHFKYKNWLQQNLSPKSDIWSAAVTIYHTLYQQLPFNGEGGLGQLIMMKSGNHIIEEILDFPEMQDYDEFIPLLTACLNLDPAERPSDLNAPIKAVFREAAFQEERVALPLITAEPKKKEKNDSRYFIYIGLMVFVFIAVITAYTFSNKTESSLSKDALASDPSQEIIEISDDTLKHMGISDMKKTVTRYGEDILTTVPVYDNKPAGFPTTGTSTSSNINPASPAQDNNPTKEKVAEINTPIINPSIPEIKTVPEEKIPEPVTIKEEKSTPKTATIKPNIPIPLALNEQINNTSDYPAGSKISFVTASDVISYGEVFIKKGTEIFAEVKKRSDKKLNIRFPLVYTSGGTKLKSLNLDNFEINIESDKKGKIYRPVTSSYQNNVLIN